MPKFISLKDPHLRLQALVVNQPRGNFVFVPEMQKGYIVTWLLENKDIIGKSNKTNC